MGMKRKDKRRAQAAFPGSGSGYGHHGASGIKSGVRHWYPHSSNADDDIVRNITELRERSRDLYMGSSIASGVIKTLRTNIVGSGLMLSAQIDFETLGMTAEQAREWEKKTEREWLLWSSGNWCDAERRQNFYQLQSLVTISALLSGDVFVALPLAKTKGCPYDLRVSLIEADRVCNPIDKSLSLEADVLGGVEVDRRGQPIAYYVANRTPGSIINSTGQTLSWQRVRAFGEKTGRPNILQIFGDIERPSQRRGLPILSPVIKEMKLLAEYAQSEVNAAAVSSKFTVYVKTKGEKSLNLPPPMGAYEQFPAGSYADRSPRDYQIGEGAVVFLDPEEELQFADPKRPNTAFGEFVKSVCRQIGAALEIPYEVLIKEFTSSYSASRGALLEAWKMFRMRREWLVSSFCQPVYEEWLTEAILKGRIEAPGFFEDPVVRKAWCGAEWFGDNQGQLDPVKEVSAAALRVENGFSTREREAAELTGLKFDSILAVRAVEEAAMKETAPSGQTGKETSSDDPDEEDKSLDNSEDNDG